MSNFRYQMVTKLMQQSLDVSVDERVGYLEEACDGDEKLFNEVMSLLQHHQMVEQENFLETLPIEILSCLTELNRDASES